MAIKVVKFGGSSLADAAQFKKVKDIIFADPERIYVVPSAPGKRSYKDEKVTDMLYKCQKQANNPEAFDQIFSRITERYVDIAFELALDINILPELEEISKKIKEGASADFAASRGEYLNGILLANYLGYDFVDAAEIIKFDQNNKFDDEGTHKTIKETLKKHKNAVIPGFYGANTDGEIVTFSRGGSDISGAIVSRGVDASIYENWTDVSGLLMADPRIVNNPKPIKTVTYTELRELAYMGASVLHDEAIFPVRQACIPINVKNTNAPEDFGTMIVPDTEKSDQDSTITGIAGKQGFTVIALEKDKMNAEVGFASGVLQVLTKHGVSIEHMPTGIDTLSVIVADAHIKGKRQQIVEEIMQGCHCDSLEIHENMALIAVVGRGMINRVGTSASVFTALAKSGVNVRMIDQGSSEMNIIIGLEASEFNTAIKAIYHEFAKE